MSLVLFYGVLCCAVLCAVLCCAMLFGGTVLLGGGGDNLSGSQLYGDCGTVPGFES